MNNISYIPNKIKQPPQCCLHCGKSYIKRINLDKHILICELIHKPNRKDTALFIEEDEPIPSQRKMFDMIVELSQKYSRLEEKVDDINKWVVKKKKKINVLEWLNANVIPTSIFDNIIESITVDEQDIQSLFANSFYDVLNEIFSKNIYNFNENDNPIFAFVQKINVFYIYTSDKIWVELSREILTKFLNKVHMKIFQAFNDYKKMKSSNLDDNFAILCNKTLVKLMTPEFNQESVLSKIKGQMYLKMKTDMKALVEYEFEF